MIASLATQLYQRKSTGKLSAFPENKMERLKDGRISEQPRATRWSARDAPASPQRRPGRRETRGKREGNALPALGSRLRDAPGAGQGRAGPGRALAPTERSEFAGRARQRRHRGLSRASPQQPRAPPLAHAPPQPHPPSYDSLTMGRACAVQEAGACRSPHRSQPCACAAKRAAYRPLMAEPLRRRAALQ